MSVVSRSRDHYPRNVGLGVSSNYHEFPGTINQMRRVLDASVEGIVSTEDHEGFTINMDVQQYKPQELTVKTSNNEIIIEGKHEERKDGRSYISRRFTKRYALPSEYEAKQVTSRLSSDGVLTVHAPFPNKLQSTENFVHIQRTARRSLKL